ncbi:lactonase family protein [Pedobacter sp. L105]|uniref:lactonase family protein n=1 Tax=Pedobacter sp. L105 TaxID=1641871 RepID=UPI00131AED14|nr:lactonase family protein [Pedobacter sp. L105]
MKKLLYVLAAALFSLSAKAQTKNYHLVIGTYTAPGVSKGIYVYDFNTANAEFKQEAVEKNVINPSFLTVTQDRRFVYAVNEDAERSMVSAFSFDEASGKLGFLNQQKAEGTDPCYLIADDKNVLIANYSSGSIAVFGRDASGALTPAKQVVQHTGSSIDTARQKGPHVHMVRFTPDHKYIVSNDLGEDKVYFYTYNKNGDDKVLVYKNSVSVKAGRGPRHIVFSPNGKFAYLIQELNADVTVFSYNDGNLKKLQDTNLATPGFKGQNGGSDIQFSADGKFLYISNRGDANTITTFAVGQNGKLLRKGQMSTGGRGPRAFVIDPSGNWLLMGHQYTNDIVIFKRNKITGELTNTGRKIDIGAPVCFVFVPKK